MNIDNEGVKEIINNGCLAELMVLMEIANKHKFEVEIDDDDEVGVHCNDGLHAALEVIGAVIDIDDDGYAVLSFDGAKWDVRCDVKINRYTPDFRKEILLYFDEVEEITS